MSAPKRKGRSGAALAAWRQRISDRLGRQTDDLWGLLLVVAGALVALAYLDLAGPVGRALATVLEVLFGLWGYVVPVALVILGAALIVRPPRREHGRFAIGLGMVFLGSLALFHLMTGALSLAGNVELVAKRGGAVGSLIAFPLRRVVGFWGAFTILLAFTGIGVLVVTRTTLREVGLTLLAAVRKLAVWAHGSRTPEVHSTGTRPGARSRPTPKPQPARPKRAQPQTRPKAKAPKQPIPEGTGSYQLPPLDLLHSAIDEGAPSRRALEETGRELERTLRQHGVDARLVRIVPGPTVTRYEIELAAGVKVSRVTGLSHDIAYALAAPEVRLLAPIPGKSAIGVEVPNRQPSKAGDVGRCAAQ